MKRDNFYILLDLNIDPPETNIRVIEEAIRIKTGKWSKMRNHPAKGIKAQSYLDMLPEIRKVMLDDALRKAEADEARQIVSRIEKEKFKKLDVTIKFLSAKKRITQKEFMELVKKFEEISEADIRKRIKVPIVEEEKTQKPKKELEKTTSKDILKNLEIIGKTSLYDFLEIPPTSSLKALQDRTKEIHEQIRKISQKTADVTAKGKLIGHCLSIFRSEEMRDAYETSLARANLEKLNELIELAGSGNHIEAAVFDQIVKQAVEMGIDREEAKQYILDLCKKRKLSVATPEKMSVEAMKQCGVCNVLNLSTAVHCENCGNPLEQACLKCGAKNSSTVRICSKCGFNVGDIPLVNNLIRKGRLALAQKELDAAMTSFRQAEVYWPDHPDIPKYIQSVLAEKKTLAKIVDSLHDAVKNKLFYQARDRLLKLKQIDAAHPDLTLEATVNQKIAAAEAFLDKAGASRNENDIIDALTQALSESKDCQEAIDKLSAIPPEPPQKLQASSSGRSITLRWQKSRSRGDITYRVVRKTDTQPGSPNDGEIIAETVNLNVDDAQTTPGVFYFYTVYSIRGRVFSRSGPVAGPVFRIGEIENLQIVPGDSRINIQWDSPGKAIDFEVYRKKGSTPLKRGDGQRLSARPDGITDHGLNNDTLYGYRIIAVYRDENGNKCYSNGVDCRSRPKEPPKPILNLQAQKRVNDIEFTWSHPPKGTVLLFRSDSEFNISEGTTLPVGKIAKLGLQIPIQSMNRTTIQLNFQGVVHVIPVTVEDEIAVIGRAIQVTSIADVSNLKSELNSGKLYVEWEWPPGAKTVLVAYRHNVFPSSPDDKSAVRIVVTYEQYKKESAFVIHKPEKKDYCFFVYVKVEEKDKTLYSTGKGLIAQGSEIKEIKYRIKVSKNLLGRVKKAVLIVNSKDGDTPLPETVLVKKLGALPLNRSGGNTIYTIEDGVVIRSRDTKFDIPLSELSKNAYAKLFFTDENKNAKFRLISAGKNDLKLF